MGCSRKQASYRNPQDYRSPTQPRTATHLVEPPTLNAITPNARRNVTSCLRARAGRPPAAWAVPRPLAGEALSRPGNRKARRVMQSERRLSRIKLWNPQAGYRVGAVIEPSTRRVRLIAVFLGVLLAAVASVPSTVRAHTRRPASRCTITTSPYGPIGVYVLTGRVSCHHATIEIHRSFYAHGVPLPDVAGTPELFSDGWICGGQMGYYFCQTPTLTNPSAYVTGLACQTEQTTCPVQTTNTTIPTGPHPTAPLALSKCAPVSYLLPGSARGVRATALTQSPDFKVRAAERAAPGELNYASLKNTCSQAMIARTWYTDLHPPGMPCHACDAHQYWVQLRSGTWAVLGDFSG